MLTRRATWTVPVATPLESPVARCPLCSHSGSQYPDSGNTHWTREYGTGVPEGLEPWPRALQLTPWESCSSDSGDSLVQGVPPGTRLDLRLCPTPLPPGLGLTRTDQILTARCGSLVLTSEASQDQVSAADPDRQRVPHLPVMGPNTWRGCCS